MKFPQLPIGATFVFQGKTYTKSSQMTATARDGGGARVIPRWADVQVAGEGAPPPRKTPATSLDSARVLHAFEAYHADCARLIDTQHIAALQSARQRFIDALSD